MNTAEYPAQLDLTEWAAEHTHHDPYESELAAAEKAFARAGTLKQKIYDILVAAGDEGMTPEEISSSLGYHTSDGGNTVRRRMIDLQKAGAIRYHAELITRKNKAGNDALVWVVGSDPDNQKTKIQVLQERIKELSEELHETQGVVMSLQLRCKEWREVALKLSAAAKQVAYNLAAKPDYNELNFALTAVERMKGETK